MTGVSNAVAVGTDFTRRVSTVRFRHNIDVSRVTESSRQVCYSDCRFERLLCGGVLLRLFLVRFIPVHSSTRSR